MKLHVLVHGKEFTSREFNPAQSNFDDTRLISCPYVIADQSGGLNKSQWARVVLETEEQGRVSIAEAQVGAFWYR